MELAFTEQDEQFRATVAQWMVDNLQGDFAEIKYRGGPGDEHTFIAERKEWEAHLAQGQWTGIGWPKEFGGQALSLEQQVIFYEEYARAGGPGRLGHIGEGLVAPTLIALGSKEQQARYLPDILSAKAIWCQGYSEPNAGSDLANIQTRAEYDETEQVWRLYGQKVWTSLAHISDYMFVLARTEKGSKRHKGLGFFLVDLHQANIQVRPIKQMSGTAEFNEVFLDGAVCSANDIVGAPGEGWKVAMRLLGFERGLSTLGQQMQFQNELNAIISAAQVSGSIAQPMIRQRIGKVISELHIMRNSALRMLSGLAAQGELDQGTLVYKLFWATLHRDMGELAVDVMGLPGLQVQDQDYALHPLQSLFLFTRADTIYAGTNEIQRNIIAERVLGMPRR